MRSPVAGPMRYPLAKRPDVHRVGALATLLALLAVAPGLTPGEVVAQQTTGQLVGRALDAEGDPISDLVVTASTPGRPDRTALTDARGFFRIGDLPVERYSVRFERIGLRTVIVEEVQVGLGASISLGEVVLEVDAVGVQPLRVRASAFGIDPSSTDVGYRIEATTFEALPTGRDAKTVLSLLPQANQSFHGDPVNVSGSTGLSNQSFIDGANVTDAFRGVTGTDLPSNFVKAVELKQGGYQAEYGQTLGGLINLVTNSGTNDFRFDAFGYFSGDRLAADPKPAPGTVETASFSDYDVGVSVGGPIARDKLWAIAAYNPSFAKSDIVLDEFGARTASVTRHKYAGKLDWQPSESSRLSVSMFGDPTQIDEVVPAGPGVTYESVDRALSVREEGSTNASLNIRTKAGERWLIEGTAGYHDRAQRREPATEAGREMAVDDRRDGIVAKSGGTGITEDFATSRMSLKAAATAFAGGHELKYGGEFQDNELTQRLEYRFLDIYAPDDFQTFIRRADGTVHNRVAALFVQDSWTVSRRLQLNLGVRWGGQWIDGGRDGTLQPIPNEWQPRIGIVFQPGELGRQKLFGYAGRFYQQMLLFQPSISFTPGNVTDLSFYSADPRSDPASLEFVLPLQDGTTLERTEGLRGEHLDEFVIGYERLLGSSSKLVVRGVHRVLRDNIQFAGRADPPARGTVGNRGRGELAHFDDARRTYSAAEVTLQHQGGAASFLASYVLSRHHGNYQGLLQPEAGQAAGGDPFEPNNNQTTWILAQDENNEGLLPNDRTHVLKLNGAYRFDFGLTAGTAFQLASGTPLSEFQVANIGFFLPVFRVPRGTAGRTPAIWDLSFRFSYELPARVDGRVVLDLLHVGNPQEVVDRDQVLYRNSLCDDGEGGVSNCGPFATYADMIAGAASRNPGFGQPTVFQPPFTVRLGFQIGL